MKVKRLIQLVYLSLAALVLFSFAGFWHAAADALAVFRLWLVTGLAVVSFGLLLWRARLLGSTGLLLGAFAAASVVMPYFKGNGQAGAYSVYQKNLLFHSNSINRIIADIRSLEPDFLTLQEIAGENRALFWVLQQENATALRCRFSRVGDVAVLSKWPAVAGSEKCFDNRGGAAIKVSTPAGPVWLISLHLHWPYPHEQAAQVSHLIAQMDFIDAPVVLAGDFNMVPWSHALRSFEEVTHSDRAGPVFGTFTLRSGPAGLPLEVRLPIDHILVPDGRGELQARPLLGSDHLGLYLQFDL